MIRRPPRSTLFPTRRSSDLLKKPRRARRRDADLHGVSIELLEAGPLLFAKIVLDIVAKRSEEHTSELQSQSNLVCRLLLEKKKNINGLIHLSIIDVRRKMTT